MPYEYAKSKTEKWIQIWESCPMQTDHSDDVLISSSELHQRRPVLSQRTVGSNDCSLFGVQSIQCDYRCIVLDDSRITGKLVLVVNCLPGT